MPAPVLQFKRGNAGVAGTVPALRPGEPAISLNNFDFFIGIDTSVANNKFFGSHRYWGREDGTNSLNLKLVDKDGTNYVAIKAPNTLGGNVTYTLPGTQGGASSVLTNDGSGNLTWASGSANPVFTGIATFSDTTDNTLGDPNTGAVQIDGGVGIAKNVTVGAGLSVTGESYFIGTATFYGGQINLGDSDGDNISVAGEFVSNLVPNDDATYNLGNSAKRWNNASFAGIGTFTTGLVADSVRLGIGGAGVVDTTSGPLYLDSAGGTTVINDHLDVIGDLDVTGNVYIGGTTVTLRGQDVVIENRDILLGMTTSVTPSDTTANHGGIAIASTEGTPLTSFTATGINTFPDTYKQMMWFKSGTLGFATDTFAFNYGVAIGTTQMADGVRLKVGSGVTVGDTTVTAANFYGALTGNVTGNASSADQVKTATASNNNANYYVTFVDANNGSATNESVYTDDGIYYNPALNKLTTQHAEFTGDVLVSGITTLAGNTTLGDSGSDIITVVGVTTFTTSNVYVDNQLFVGGIQVTGGVAIGQDVITRHLDVTGISTFAGAINANGDVTLGNASGDTITVKGTTTFEQPVVGTISTATRASLIDTANTTNNSDYYVTFVDTLAGQSSENLRVGLGLSVNPSNGDVKTTGRLSVGNPGNLTSYIKAGGGSDAMYLYANGDVSFQAKVIASQIRSQNNATTLITLDDLDATFARNITVAGIATVGTSLSSPTIRTNLIKSSDTNATAITINDNDVTIADDLTVSGNLYVNGNTTQVNTTAITVEDRTIELGVVDGTTTSTTTWDLGVLFNYGDSGTARKSAVIWEHSDSRFKFAKILDADSNGSNANTPQLTVNTYAPIEVAELWVNNTCTGGSSQVIACSGGELILQNITVDAGSF